MANAGRARRASRQWAVDGHAYRIGARRAERLGYIRSPPEHNAIAAAWATTPSTAGRAPSQQAKIDALK
jgi:hypothetical protein